MSGKKKVIKLEGKLAPKYDAKKGLILLVEDQQKVKDLLRDFFEGQGFLVKEASDGKEALDIAMMDKPQLVLTDISMPNMDGFELVKRLRAHQGTALIPVLFITAHTDLETKISVFKAGGDGVLTKPFDLDELQARVDRALQFVETYEKLTYVDALTNIYNRRFFDERVIIELNRAKRYTYDVAIAMTDIDFFKKFNDTYGHQAGDFILNSLAQFCKQRLRSQDYVCRYGGEEYIIIMPMTNSTEAHLVMNRIRDELDKSVFKADSESTEFHVNISVGISYYPADGEDFETVIRHADSALYESKRAGRNKVTIFKSKEDLKFERRTKQ